MFINNLLVGHYDSLFSMIISSSALACMISMPLERAIVAIDSDGSTSVVMPNGAENRPVPTPTSTPTAALAE